MRLVRDAYVNDVTVKPKRLRDAIERATGKQVKIQTLARSLRKVRLEHRGYKKAGFLGETSDKPEILRSYGSEKTLTTFEIGLMTLSIIVGIATIASVWLR